MSCESAGLVEADEVVQLFVAPSEVLLASATAQALARKALKGFARVSVKPGNHAVVQLPLSSSDFQYATSAGKHLFTYSVLPGIQVCSCCWQLAQLCVA